MSNDNAPGGASEALAERLRAAETRIAEQRQELAALRAELARDTFVDELHQALVRMGAAGQLAAPVAQTDLLDLTIGTAAQVLSARAASLFLIDRATDELVFEVALGERAATARKFRVPVGQGIAGWVAQAGEPVLVADTTHDPRFAADVARSIGYVPKSILCIPLRLDESVIGVVEVMDKQGGQPFDETDQALLEKFAAEAAVAIEQAGLVRDVRLLFGRLLDALLAGDTEGATQHEALRRHADEFAERTAQSAEYRDALEITQVVTDISQRSPEARHLCQEIIAGIAAYAGSATSRTGPPGQP